MKGICFKEMLFFAILRGEKIQTRRIKTSDKVKYKVGEAIYLKEPYMHIECNNSTDMSVDSYIYKYNPATNFPGLKIKYQNKLFMPKKAARYFIKITGVRSEKLQDISTSDCFAEGIAKRGSQEIFGLNGEMYLKSDEPFWHVSNLGTTAKMAFANLINKICGKNTWESNLEVWIYDFILCNKTEINNED